MSQGLALGFHIGVAFEERSARSDFLESSLNPGVIIQHLACRRLRDLAEMKALRLAKAGRSAFALQFGPLEAACL